MSASEGSPAWRRRIRLRRIGLFISALLLGGAVVVLWREREVIEHAIDAMRRPAPGPLAMLLLAMLGNIVLAGATFSLLLAKQGQPRRVGILEMQALMAATSLVNFLPLRPGALGRVAYHKTVNGIPVAESVRAIVIAAVLSAASACYLAAVAAICIRFNLSIWPAIALPVIVLAFAPAFGPLRFIALAGLCRYGEVMLWAVRYHAAFAIIGTPISPEAAVGFACISTAATMVPLFSNGLGLREWAVGLVAPLLAGVPLELGLTAELVNRALEMAVMFTFGVAALVYLSRRRGRLPAPNDAAA
ncbi:MAG TPA: hypothetical protein PK400_11340 [Phycisphaerales bacterium]|nr:hypothetical protein [Phycisphaerales bacterium]HRQ75789.1 hypothetical protein [Phycisphaerales bacterium]